MAYVCDNYQRLFTSSYSVIVWVRVVLKIIVIVRRFDNLSRSHFQNQVPAKCLKYLLAKGNVRIAQHSNNLSFREKGRYKEWAYCMDATHQIIPKSYSIVGPESLH